MPWGDYDWQRMIAEQFVAAAFEEAGITSADDYYRWLQEQELGVIRDIARDVWAEYRNSYQWLDVLARYPERATIPRGWYASTESDYIERYGYKLKLTFVDPESGEQRERMWLVKSDTALSRAELNEQIVTDVPEKYPGLIQEIVGYEYTTLYHHAGAAW